MPIIPLLAIPFGTLAVPCRGRGFQISNSAPSKNVLALNIPANASSQPYLWNLEPLAELHYGQKQRRLQILARVCKSVTVNSASLVTQNTTTSGHPCYIHE
jgi:hypothetical protein